MTHVTLSHTRDGDATAPRLRAEPEPSQDFGATHEASSANLACRISGYLAPPPLLAEQQEVLTSQRNRGRSIRLAMNHPHKALPQHPEQREGEMARDGGKLALNPIGGANVWLELPQTLSPYPLSTNQRVFDIISRPVAACSCSKQETSEPSNPE